MSPADNAAAAARLRDELHHYDPVQLWFQLQEIVVEQSYLRHGVEVGPGDIVLDVGANAGVAAVFFASVCGADAVHSFEPVPELFELLERNVSRYPACTCHPYGLGRSPGAAAFTFYRGAAAMSGLYADPNADRELTRTAMLNLGATAEAADADLAARYVPESIRCELRTLSSVIAQLQLDRVDLLKIDVEKAELDVLAGLEADDWLLIRRLVVEVYDLDGRVASLCDQLEGRGFAIATEQEPAFRGTPIHMLYAVR